MIFVVVGTQEPFNRLIEYMDDWSSLSGYTDITAQIADGAYKPRNFKWFNYLPPNEFDTLFREAELIVGHAGMGTIISALQYLKPVIVMPRLAKFKEHRNDHQLATAISFSKLGYVTSVYSNNELYSALGSRKELKPAPPISQYASKSLLSFIEDFVNKKQV